MDVVSAKNATLHGKYTTYFKLRIYELLLRFKNQVQEISWNIGDCLKCPNQICSQ